MCNCDQQKLIITTNDTFGTNQSRNDVKGRGGLL